MPLSLLLIDMKAGYMLGEFRGKINHLLFQGRIQKGFATGQPVWDPKFLPQINKKIKILK